MTVVTGKQFTLVNLNSHWNPAQINTRDLSRIEKNEIEEHYWEADYNFGWDQSRFIPRKIKEIINSLKNPNHIKKDSYMLSEIWLPNLR